MDSCRAMFTIRKHYQLMLPQAIPDLVIPSSFKLYITKNSNTQYQWGDELECLYFISIEEAILLLIPCIQGMVVVKIFWNKQRNGPVTRDLFVWNRFLAWVKPGVTTCHVCCLHHTSNFCDILSAMRSLIIPEETFLIFWIFFFSWKRSFFYSHCLELSRSEVKLSLFLIFLFPFIWVT